MKILNIVPITTDIWNDDNQAYSTKFLLPDTQVITKNLRHGPASIESEYDEALATPEIVFLCKEAEREGFDGVFINCFGDPGVRTARCCVDIPVFGGFEPAIFYSLGIADRIGIVTVLPNVVSMLRGIIAHEGLGHRVVSIRDVHIPVLDLSGIDKLVAALISESKKAIVEDKAGTICLGCTGMIGVKDGVEKGLEEAGYKITVLEAAQASLMMLETFIRMGLRHSRLTYMPPPDKSRSWWDGDGVKAL